MANGSRCTIYTAFYGATAVVVKVMRKDVGDKDLVRQVCDSNGGSRQDYQRSFLPFLEAEYMRGVDFHFICSLCDCPWGFDGRHQVG